MKRSLLGSILALGVVFTLYPGISGATVIEYPLYGGGGGIGVSTAFTPTSTFVQRDIRAAMDSPGYCYYNPGNLQLVIEKPEGTAINSSALTGDITCTSPPYALLGLQDFTYLFPASTTFTEGETYYFRITTLYPGGGNNDRITAHWGGDGTIYLDDTGGAPPATSSVAITAPANGTTTSSTSSTFWTVHAFPGQLSCSPSAPCTVAVNYWPGSSSSTPDAVLSDFAEPITTTSAEDYSFDLGTPLANGQYWAYPVIGEAFPPSHLPVSGAKITFTITGSDVPAGVSATTTLSSTTVLCTADNWFLDGLCGMASYLLIPSPESVARMVSIKDLVAEKPPLGYFTLIRASLLNLAVGSSSQQLLSSSTAADLDGVFSPLRTGISALLWIAFAYWVVHKISTMDI